MRSRASGVLGTITGTAPGTGDVLGLSRVERLVACMVCLGLAAFCFFIAFTLLPFLVLNLRKFAMLYTMGSLLALLGIAVLHGLSAHLAHLCSAERLPFTLCYFGTMGLTLYLSFAHKPHLLIIFASIAQMLCLVWYFVSYLPGGVAGLSWMSRTVSRVALRL
ncbi:hypothetical protein CXG81DRAFT_12787 [Caulochytrium protostelioides]|uniref:Protein transport protein SFT2 n=1 Tax=Caulochytrium protostelioides TaxID=1555241 RepID=A0A4P9X6L5_9FUNG|nr:SFT2-domain-containing protein [Caulochytrium protostelioides]RKP00823.1 hypothetical protein CXG81DRAFT_12787 [Caulochytrium protostelioides]|eukprot:RKP00823.1 hypothetical protein CXG81DRAFT_12787 [Caulochytrium protostelioides]